MSQWGITPRGRLRSMSIWLSNVNGCTWNILESHLNPISGNYSMCSLFPSENTVNDFFHGMTHPQNDFDQVAEAPTIHQSAWLVLRVLVGDTPSWSKNFQGIRGTKFPTNQPLRVYQTDDKLVHSEPSLVFWGQAIHIYLHFASEVPMFAGDMGYRIHNLS